MAIDYTDRKKSHKHYTPWRTGGPFCQTKRAQKVFENARKQAKETDGGKQ